MQRGQRVANAHADPHRHAARFGGQVAQAAYGFCDHAKTRLVAVGAGLAVAADAQHDQARIEFEQFVGAKPPAFHRAGAKVLDQHIGVQRELAHDGLRVKAFQVERDRAFVARLDLPPERRAVFQQPPFAQWVAGAGGLDLDDVSAKISQCLGGERAGNQLAQLQDFQAGQRALRSACGK